MTRMLKRVIVYQMIFFILFFTGCNIAQRPEGQAGGAPAIPDAIHQGENQEPELTVYVAENGAKETMSFEEYITGVVAAEMDPDWPLEALAAQAILARTFTLQKIAEDGGVPNRGTHASTDIEEFQAYDASRITDRVRQAVESTRGEIVGHNGRFIRAWFHAYSGGKTATAKEGLVFEEEETPYIKVVDDPGQEVAPEDVTNWTVQLNTSEVRQKVGERVGKEIGAINSIEVVETGESGRATMLSLGGQQVSAPAFRLSMDSTKVKSTWFKDISVNGNTITINGTGYGHGVGMSQWGARAMAEQGDSPEDIVLYWFNDVEIFKLWE